LIREVFIKNKRVFRIFSNYLLLIKSVITLYS